MISSNFYIGGPRNGQLKDKRDWNNFEWLSRAARFDSLKSMMKKCHLSQSALARKIGVRQSTVSRWLGHQSRPQKKALQSLVHLWESYGFSIDV